MTPTAARRAPVVKTIGGVTFEDPWWWLAEDSPAALAWQAKANQHAVDAARGTGTFDVLASRIAPHLVDPGGHRGVPRCAGGQWFHLGRNDAGDGQAIRVSSTRDGDGRQLVDAAALPSERGAVLLLQLDPSPDGRLVAFVTMAGGEMTGALRVVEADTGQLLDVDAAVLPYNVPRPGWLPDGTGLFLQDRAADGRHQIRFVPVATSAAARATATFSFDDVAPTRPGLVPQVSPGGSRVVAVTVPHEHVAAMLGDVASGRWRPFLPADHGGECFGDWLDDEHYVAIVTDVDAPRGRVVIIPAATSTDARTWREIVAPSDAVLCSLVVLPDRIALATLVDVELRMRLLTLDGDLLGDVELPPAAASVDLVSSPRLQPRAEELAFTITTFTQPATVVRLDPRGTDLHAVGTPGPTLDGVCIEQRFARSADGTAIPYWTIAREDRDAGAPHPTLVNAYGGFNVAFVPTYLGHLAPFVEAGGTFVHACLRGGSEYGRAWYDAGRRHQKQHTFDDLRAVAEDLISRGDAAPSTLAFHGASNGGLLAGVAITQQHDLWRVVVPQVPLFDLLEPLVDGPSAETVRSYYLQDYGDARDPEDAPVLAAYSPYHNVVDGTPYPAVFSLFGEHDVGCPPFHGRKLTARLLEATTSGHPVHLRVWPGVGHGAVGDTAIAQHAEWLAFVMDQLGMRVRA